MPAVEVELLADALATADPRSEKGSEDDNGVTRILVVPDPGPGEPAFDDDQVDDAAVLAATRPAATVPAATVPRPGDLPYLGSAPLSAGRSAPDRPGPARAGGADHPPPARPARSRPAPDANRDGTSSGPRTRRPRRRPWRQRHLAAMAHGRPWVTGGGSIGRSALRAALVVPRRYGAPPPGGAPQPRHGSRAPRAPGAEPDRRPAGGPDHGAGPTRALHRPGRTRSTARPSRRRDRPSARRTRPPARAGGRGPRPGWRGVRAR